MRVKSILHCFLLQKAEMADLKKQMSDAYGKKTG